MSTVLNNKPLSSLPGIPTNSFHGNKYKQGHKALHATLDLPSRDLDALMCDLIWGHVPQYFQLIGRVRAVPTLLSRERTFSASIFDGCPFGVAKLSPNGKPH